MLQKILKTSNFENIALSLAGISASIELVRLLATTGRCPPLLFQTALEPILIFTAETPASIYPEGPLLPFGASILYSLLKRTLKTQHRGSWRYLLGCFYLAEKIAQKKHLANTIQEQLKQVKRQVFHFGLTHENTITTLGSIYGETLGQLPMKIYISGKKMYLQQPLIRNQIRALLLSAVRSAVLWQQCGGRKYHFLFSRDRLLKALHHLHLQSSEAFL